MPQLAKTFTGCERYLKEVKTLGTSKCSDRSRFEVLWCSDPDTAKQFITKLAALQYVDRHPILKGCYVKNESSVSTGWIS